MALSDLTNRQAVLGASAELDAIGAQRCSMTSLVPKQIADLPEFRRFELKALCKESFAVQPPAYPLRFLIRGPAPPPGANPWWLPAIWNEERKP